MKENKQFSNRDILILGFIIMFLNSLFIKAIMINFTINLIAIGLIIFTIIKIIKEKSRKKKNKPIKTSQANTNNKIRGFISKIQKITLPISILLSMIIFALTFLTIQYLKQESIERQLEIKNKLSISEEKKECLEIANNEEHWSNYHSYYYDIDKNVCVVKYENKDWEENHEKLLELKDILIQKLKSEEITIEEAKEQVETFRLKSNFSKQTEDEGQLFTKEF